MTLAAARFEIEDFVFVPISEATRPIAGTPRVIVDSYWLIDGQDRIAFYNPRRPGGRGRQGPGLGSAQHNSHPEAGERVGPRYPWYLETRQIPLVFVPTTWPHIERWLKGKFGATA